MAVSGLNRDKIAGKKKPSTEYPRVAVSGLNRDFSSTEYPMVTVSGLNRDKIARKVARSVAGKYKPLHWPRMRAPVVCPKPFAMEGCSNVARNEAHCVVVI